jgi:hypothetical protein
MLEATNVRNAAPIMDSGSLLCDEITDLNADDHHFVHPKSEE